MSDRLLNIFALAAAAFSGAIATAIVFAAYLLREGGSP